MCIKTNISSFLVTSGKTGSYYFFGYSDRRTEYLT